MEWLGVLAAVLSSGLGGTSVGATRYLADALDPLTLGALRFGIGALLLLPLALRVPGGRPQPGEWPALVGLGLLFFGLFPILFNASLIFTTAARGGLALSTVPLLTMLAAALLGVERLTLRKSLGVLVAMGGVAAALLLSLAKAPEGAWRGDLLMVAAAGCMALYNVWSRRLVRRLGAVPFATFGMAVGALSLGMAAVAMGGVPSLARLGTAQWAAVLYLGLFGGALTFWLWAFALLRTTPTRVAISVTVNPVLAALIGAMLLGEPLHWSLVIGLAMVALGIWLSASSPGGRLVSTLPAATGRPPG
jgi:drug/metabolite transporter (DMT)-like permease